MIEAVGEANWPTYFRVLHDRLKPGGAAAVQAITIDERLYSGYRAKADFIQRYIFPGRHAADQGHPRRTGGGAPD